MYLTLLNCSLENDAEFYVTFMLLQLQNLYPLFYIFLSNVPCVSQGQLFSVSITIFFQSREFMISQEIFHSFPNDF